MNASCAGPNPASSSAAQSSQAPQPEQASDITKLTLKLERQISAGRLDSPSGDNAMETLQHILALVPNASPSDLDAIDTMSTRFDQRAMEARVRGDTKTAERFSAFRDALAVEGRTTPVPGPVGLPNAPALAPPTRSGGSAVDQGAAVQYWQTTPEAKSGSETALSRKPASGESDRLDTRPDAAGFRPATEPKPLPISGSPAKPAETKPSSTPEQHLSSIGAATPDSMIALLLRRGQEKLAQRDISAARLLFQRAAAAGNGAGALGLAKTYDPVALTLVGAGTIQADAGLATEWYQKALALGAEEAGVSLSKLERWKLENAGSSRARMAPSP